MLPCIAGQHDELCCLPYHAEERTLVHADYTRRYSKSRCRLGCALSAAWCLLDLVLLRQKVGAAQTATGFFAPPFQALITFHLLSLT